MLVRSPRRPLATARLARTLATPLARIATAQRLLMLGVASLTLILPRSVMGLTMPREVSTRFYGTRPPACQSGTLLAQTFLWISPTRRPCPQTGVRQQDPGVLRRAILPPISTNTRWLLIPPSVGGGLDLLIVVLAAPGLVLTWLRTRPTLSVSWSTFVQLCSLLKPLRCEMDNQLHCRLPINNWFPCTIIPHSYPSHLSLLPASPFSVRVEALACMLSRHEYIPAEIEKGRTSYYSTQCPTIAFVFITTL